MGNFRTSFWNIRMGLGEVSSSVYASMVAVYSRPEVSGSVSVMSKLLALLGFGEVGFCSVDGSSTMLLGGGSDGEVRLSSRVGDGMCWGVLVLVFLLSTFPFFFWCHMEALTFPPLGDLLWAMAHLVLM